MGLLGLQGQTSGGVNTVNLLGRAGMDWHSWIQRSW